MVSNLALKCKATDKTEITVSSGKEKQKEAMSVNSLFCLCSKMIISDVEKLNVLFFWCSNHLRFYCFYLFLEEFCVFFFFFLFKGAVPSQVIRQHILLIQSSNT